MLKTIITSILTTLIVCGLVLGQSHPSKLGGFTTYDSMELNGSGTTTLKFTGTTSGAGSCIQMKDTSGTSTRIFLKATSTALTVEAGTCQ